MPPRVFGLLWPKTLRGAKICDHKHKYVSSIGRKETQQGVISWRDFPIKIQFISRFSIIMTFVFQIQYSFYSTLAIVFQLQHPFYLTLAVVS